MYIKKLHDFLNFPAIKVFLEEEDRRREGSSGKFDKKQSNKKGKLGETDSFISEEKMKINHKDKIEERKEI